MKKQIIYSFIAFILGYMANNILSVVIKPAYAYCECNEYDFNFSSSDIYDFQSEVESIIDDKISQYNYDFQSAVESIIEDCQTDNYGEISC